MCPLFEYEHPKTGEIFEVLRSVKDRNKPFIAPDGKKCKRIIPSSFNGWMEGREIFEMDPEYVKKCRPRKIRYRDNHVEKYDPTKHC
jgi:hypothetical protein